MDNKVEGDFVKGYNLKMLGKIVGVYVGMVVCLVGDDRNSDINMSENREPMELLNERFAVA